MRKFTKITALLFALMLLVGFVACAGGSDTADDPNLGLYEATTGEMYGIALDIKDVYEGGFSIELKPKNKCRIEIDGQGATGKYTLDGTSFTCEGGGVEMEGTLSDGVIVIDDLMDSGLTMTFVKAE